MQWTDVLLPLERLSAPSLNGIIAVLIYRFSIPAAIVLPLVCLMALTSAGAQDAVVEMRANLSPSQARAALNYEPTAGPLQSFFPDCARSDQTASDLRNASGELRAILHTDRKAVHFSLTYRGLSGSPIMAHFHNGAPGAAGPVLQTVCGNPPPTSAIGVSATAIMGKTCPSGEQGVMAGTWKLVDHQCPSGSQQSCTSRTIDEQIQQLACGNIYFNIHTCLNQPGEIAGQLIPIGWLGKAQDCNALPPKAK